MKLKLLIAKLKKSYRKNKLARLEENVAYKLQRRRRLAKLHKEIAAEAWKLTFTKTWMRNLMKLAFVITIWAYALFTYALITKYEGDVIKYVEIATIAIDGIIMTDFMAYFCKSYFETKAEKEQDALNGINIVEKAEQAVSKIKDAIDTVQSNV